MLHRSSAKELASQNGRNLGTKRRSVARLAFPDDLHIPPIRSKHIGHLRIAPDVAFELCNPKLSISHGSGRSPALCVTVPKATVYEECDPMPGEDEIRAAWQVAAMESESVPKGMCGRSNRKLGLCILAPHLRHAS